MGYLEVEPGSGWTPRNGLVLEHDLVHTFYGTLPAYTLVWDLQVPAEGFARTSGKAPAARVSKPPSSVRSTKKAATPSASATRAPSSGPTPGPRAGRCAGR